MIEQNDNVIKDKSIERLVNYSDGDKQINVLDARFYSRKKEFYPSVTSVLNYFPKNQYFISWIKDVGYNSEIIAKKAAEEGNQVHKAAERLLEGKEIEWLDEYGKAKYSLEVWKMILKFADFWNKVKPELVASEYHLFSDEHKYAGTSDIICRIDGELWLIDIKTTKSLHTTMDLQLAAYAKAWNETHNEPITRTGILWLKSMARSEGKAGKFQGKGWVVKIVDNIEDNFKMFMNVYSIWKLENPKPKPHTEILPTSVKLA